jgi:NTP pyrophosphatase (non-canonical NTP hydrolase)
MEKIMRVKYSNFKEASIDDFYNDFNEVWARDSNERSIFDLWLHVVDHGSKIARAVKQDNPPGIIDDIADTTVWLMSFISFCEKLSSNDINSLTSIENPSEIIWNKYPAICPMCFDNWIIDKLELSNSKSPLADFNERYKGFEEFFDEKIYNELYLITCDCLNRTTINMEKNVIIDSLRTELDTIRREYANHLKIKDKKLLKVMDIENMFNKIYSNYYQVLSLESIIFNLLGEIGEASQAIVNLYTYDESREPFSYELLKKRKQRFSEEIADIFAWLFAASIKIRLTYGKIAHLYYITLTKSNKWSENIYDLNFADIIWAKYGMTSDGANLAHLNCPGCQSAPCICQRDLKINWDSTSAFALETKDNSQLVNIESEEKNLVFISYSHKDVKSLNQIKSMLMPLLRDKKISLWDDTRIQPGERWREEIDSALSRAKVALLLVSSDFLESDFIAKNELPPLLELAKTGGTKVLWVPLSSCMYKETELINYQAVCDTGKPLDTLSKPKRNKILVDICEIIKEYAQEKTVM